jgi:hypothetical protein
VCVAHRVSVCYSLFVCVAHHACVLLTCVFVCVAHYVCVHAAHRACVLLTAYVCVFSALQEARVGVERWRLHKTDPSVKRRLTHREGNQGWKTAVEPKDWEPMRGCPDDMTHLLAAGAMRLACQHRTNVLSPALRC